MELTTFALTTESVMSTCMSSTRLVRKLNIITAGMATMRPKAVVTSASEMPGATCASDAEPLSCVLVRSGQEPVVVNLDLPNVEPNPEQVHWVDNIHPDPTRAR